MAYTGNAKVQHYMPRFLLKNFGAGKKHSLQSAHAERFVLSSTDELLLAKRMLADHPGLLSGYTSALGTSEL